MEGDNTDLATVDDALEESLFKYKNAADAPESHRRVAIQYAYGAELDIIAGTHGFKVKYVEQILRHPPIADVVSAVREALDEEVVAQLQEWTGLLPKAVSALKDSLVHDNPRVRLTAALEYLDRHPSQLFAKKKVGDANKGPKVMDTSSIEELKRNAVKTEGADYERTIGGSDRGGEATAGSLRPDSPGAAGAGAGAGITPVGGESGVRSGDGGDAGSAESGDADTGADDSGHVEAEGRGGITPSAGEFADTGGSGDTEGGIGTGDGRRPGDGSEGGWGHRVENSKTRKRKEADALEEYDPL